MSGGRQSAISEYGEKTKIKQCLTFTLRRFSYPDILLLLSLRKPQPLKNKPKVLHNFSNERQMAFFIFCPIHIFLEHTVHSTWHIYQRGEIIGQKRLNDCAGIVLVTIIFKRVFVKSGVVVKVLTNAYASTVYWKKSKFSWKHHKFAEFREYIQLEHHFSHNVQVLKTKMVDFLMICTQKKICGLVTI